MKWFDGRPHKPSSGGQAVEACYTKVQNPYSLNKNILFKNKRLQIIGCAAVFVTKGLHFPVLTCLTISEDDMYELRLHEENLFYEILYIILFVCCGCFCSLNHGPQKFDIVEDVKNDNTSSFGLYHLAWLSGSDVNWQSTTYCAQLLSSCFTTNEFAKLVVS